MANFTNHLIHESSPYLLQHAHNPVNWLPYTTKVLKEAKASNKLMLISIGYAACHWCHVMEEKCFENIEIASVMNDFYTNIKVDREEKPDVDHSYMQALQLMTRQGGWPLNIIALPDGRPVWGATYVPPEQWKSVLLQLKDLYKKDPEKMLEYANKLESGLQQMQLIQPEDFKQTNFSKDFLRKNVAEIKEHFDHKNGGNYGAPKFMMPTNFDFLLHFASLQKNQTTENFVYFTLKKMAFGGIFDQLAGGFSRYSVDERWHIPHFEKMLYDNAQLVSLYANAYQYKENNLFKEIVEKTLAFMQTDWLHKEGGFYASLDADSIDKNGKLTEGAFYVWEKENLKTILGNDYKYAESYFNINEYGYWEDQKYVLVRKESAKEIANNFKIPTEELSERINTITRKLLAERNKRTQPRLDNKILTSWNALTAKAFCDAYAAFNQPAYLQSAQGILDFILRNNLQKDKKLLRSYGTKVEGCLDDYAFLIEALLVFYQESFETFYLEKADELMQTSIDLFLDTEQSLFFYTPKTNSNLFLKTKEIEDNVIPSSNAVMADNLFNLSKYFAETSYLKLSQKMLAGIQSKISRYPGAYTNWLKLACKFSFDFYEIVIVGPKASEIKSKFNAYYLPNCIFAGSKFPPKGKNTPVLLKNRGEKNKTLIYICKNQSCSAPQENFESAIKALQTDSVNKI